MADHVIPGMVVLAMVYVAIRWNDFSARTTAAGVVVMMAGAWMVLTHIHLLGSAALDQNGSVATLYHCSGAVLVLLIGVQWVWHCREHLPDDS